MTVEKFYEQTASQGESSCCQATRHHSSLANTCCRGATGGCRRMQDARMTPPRLTQRQRPAGDFASRVPFNNAEDDHLAPLESPSIFLKRNVPRQHHAATR